MRHGFLGIVIAGVLAAATPADAQAPAPAVGRSVWITMTDGTVHRGSVAGETSDAIRLQINGETTALAKSDVRRIEATDGVGDGIAKGAIGLAIVGAAGAGYLAYATCESANCAPYTLKVGFVGAAMGGAAGALVGGLIDAAIPGRQVLFEQRTLTVVPVITGRSRSLTVLVRW
jgi:hypothetical protein